MFWKEDQRKKKKRKKYVSLYVRLFLVLFIIEANIYILQTSVIDIAFCLKATATEDQAAKTVMPKNNDKIIESKDEILANVLWKLLELRQ